MNSVARKVFTLTIDDSLEGGLDAVEQELMELGVCIENRLPELGVLSVSAEDTQADSLRQVNGVESADADQQFSLPPMSDRLPQ